MLIMIIMFIATVVMPTAETYISALFEPLMTIVIMLGGFMLLFASVGVRISANLGSTVVGGIFRVISSVATHTLRGIWWVIRYAFNTFPRVYVYSRANYRRMGMSERSSYLLAILTAVLVFIIII